jgi:uncharacterized protein (TIGR02646 family)
MRRVERVALDADVVAYLAKRQLDANKKLLAKTLKTDSHWASSRQTKNMKAAFTCLQAMMGQRARCMYCLDSHGSDIEHFWPKASFQKRMYDWDNLLLCCAVCGRFKGDTFPLRNGQPLLLNPCKEEPWQYLDFNPMTGIITARFDVAENAYQVKGEKTVEVLQFDRREALAAGYKKTYRSLCARINIFLEAPTTAAALINDLIEHEAGDRCQIVVVPVKAPILYGWVAARQAGTDAEGDCHEVTK